MGIFGAVGSKLYKKIVSTIQQDGRSGFCGSESGSLGLESTFKLHGNIWCFGYFFSFRIEQLLRTENL